MEWKFFVAILVGCLVSNLFKLNKALKVGDFSWKKFGLDNGIPAVINVILGGVAVYGKDELVGIYQITFVSSLVLGAGGQYIWKSIFDTFSPGVSTYLGFNDKP